MFGDEKSLFSTAPFHHHHLPHGTMTIMMIEIVAEEYSEEDADPQTELGRQLVFVFGDGGTMLSRIHWRRGGIVFFGGGGFDHG